MSILRAKKMSWQNVGILKLAVLCLGISAGVYWQDAFMPFLSWILIVGVLLGIYSASVWLRSHD